MTEALLLDETSGEEEASWLAAVESLQDEAQAFARRVTALARGYVLAQQAGRGELAVADVMGGFAVDRRGAENCLTEALSFVSHPDTLTALAERRLPLRHARALMDVLQLLPPELADQVEARVLATLADAPGRPPARVRELARREALRLDPGASVRRRQAAARTRHVSLRDAGDGMVEMVLLMRAEHGLQVLHRACQHSVQDDGNGRTRDQRQLDWIVQRLLADGASASSVDQPAAAESAAASSPATAGSALVPDGRRRRPVQVLVHVPAVTALGLADEPCELQEIGPIDAEHGRLLLSVAELRKVCVDARTGQVLHVEDVVVRPVADPQRVRDLGGTSRAREQATAEAVRQAVLDMIFAPSVLPVDPEPQYRPSAGLARTVRCRHPRCDFLTCGAPSRSADLEHDRPYDQRGETSASNLRPRSRWCHRAKQRGWTAGLLPDGHTVWRSPSGRSYPAAPQHEPPPLPPPGAVLPPPQPPPPRDDDQPPEHWDPGWADRPDRPLIQPRRRRATDRPARSGAQIPPPADHGGWPDDPTAF